MSDKATWITHEFNVHTSNANWNDVAGVYIFTGLNQANQWEPLYIGQASSLAVRLATHERWTEAARLGATHIHAKAVQKQTDRDLIEQELIQA